MRYINALPLPFDIRRQAYSSYGPNCIREMADEAKSSYAEVLKENTYMLIFAIQFTLYKRPNN